jgi:Flp pilus assembly pilin Flp
MTPRTRGRDAVTATAHARRFHVALRARVASIATRHDEGVTALEYVLLGSLVAMAIILGANLLGGNLGNAYQRVATVVSETF